MATDNKRFSITPLSYENADRALPGEIVVDDETGYVYVKNRDTNELVCANSAINENLEECALRELYEETGLTYSVDFLKTCKTIVIYEYIYFIIILDNKVNNFIIHDNNEILSCDWMSIPELLSVYYKCNQGIKKILTNWNFYKNFFIKSN